MTDGDSDQNVHKMKQNVSKYSEMKAGHELQEYRTGTDHLLSTSALCGKVRQLLAAAMLPFLCLVMTYSQGCRIGF